MIEFNPKLVLELATQLIEHDETERALVVLDQLPGYFRDNIPPEISKLKSDIRSKIFTVQDYIENAEDDLKSQEQNLAFLNNTARGLVLREEVKRANDRNVKPHLIDYGPGDYGLPLGLQSSHLKFHYTPIALQDNVLTKAKKELNAHWIDDYKKESDKEKWFLAYEIIEHLHHPLEIRQVFDKIEGSVKKLFFSTPKYTYGTGNPTWRTRGIPHLRTYTPLEFGLEITRMFPGYELSSYDNEVMVIVGNKI